MYIAEEERIEGKLYHQSAEGFLEFTEAEALEYNAKLAAHLLEQQTNGE